MARWYDEAIYILIKMLNPHPFQFGFIVFMVSISIITQNSYKKIGIEA